MGKQRTRIVKRKASRIYESISKEFTEDFQENKEKLKKFNLPLSKVDRNVMAGYITNKVAARNNPSN